VKSLVVRADPGAVTKILSTFANGFDQSFPINHHTPGLDAVGTIRVVCPPGSSIIFLPGGVIKISRLKAYLNLTVFTFRIDWHAALSIPKHACLLKVDACGVHFEICWDWDFGVTSISLCPPNGPFGLEANMPGFIDGVRFNLKAVDGKPGYALLIQIPIVGQLVALVPGLVSGMIDHITDEIGRFLDRVLGTGEIAKLFKALLLGAWALLSGVLWLLGDVLGTLFAVLEKAIETALGGSLFEVDSSVWLPADYPLMKEDGAHKAVTLLLTAAPKASLGDAGLTVEISE
jgi:hypothetical protein